MGRKPAKGRPSSSSQRPDDSAGRIVAVSGGHAIGSRVAMTARCGAPLSGWRYGTAEDVRCAPCGEQK